MNGRSFCAAVATAILPQGYCSLLAPRDNATMVYGFSEVTEPPNVFFTLLTADIVDP